MVVTPSLSPTSPSTPANQYRNDLSSARTELTNNPHHTHNLQGGNNLASTTPTMAAVTRPSYTSPHPHSSRQRPPSEDENTYSPFPAAQQCSAAVSEKARVYQPPHDAQFFSPNQFYPQTPTNPSSSKPKLRIVSPPFSPQKESSPIPPSRAPTTPKYFGAPSADTELESTLLSFSDDLWTTCPTFPAAAEMVPAGRRSRTPHAASDEFGLSNISGCSSSVTSPTARLLQVLEMGVKALYFERVTEIFREAVGIAGGQRFLTDEALQRSLVIHTPVTVRRLTARLSLFLIRLCDYLSKEKGCPTSPEDRCQVAMSCLQSLGWRVQPLRLSPPSTSFSNVELHGFWLAIPPANIFDVVPAHPDETKFVIDFQFLDLFTIARPSEQYEEFLADLRMEFVGTVLDLRETVRVVSSEATRSLESRTMPVPPWRAAPFIEACFVRAVEAFFASASSNAGQLLSPRASSIVEFPDDCDRLGSRFLAANESLMHQMPLSRPLFECPFEYQASDEGGMEDTLTFEKQCVSGAEVDSVGMVSHPSGLSELLSPTLVARKDDKAILRKHLRASHSPRRPSLKPSRSENSMYYV